MNSSHMYDVSFVVPVYNEEENIPEPLPGARGRGRRARAELRDDLHRRREQGRVLPALSRLQAADPRVKVIRLRRNFGQTAAMSAGFDHARGEIIVTLDADLQNDPADIPLLLAKIDEGLRRRQRLAAQDARTSSSPGACPPWWPTGSSRASPASSSTTTAARSRPTAARSSRTSSSTARCTASSRPSPAPWATSIAEVPVNHRPRIHGKSKYNLSKSIRVFLDLLTVKFLLSYSTRPLQIFGLFGLIAGIIGGIIGLALSYQRLVLKIGIGNRPLLLLAIILIVIGFQFITMGLLGEIMVRTYHEAVEKHIYVVRDVLDADGEPRDLSA